MPSQDDDAIQRFCAENGYPERERKETGDERAQRVRMALYGSQYYARGGPVKMGTGGWLEALIRRARPATENLREVAAGLSPFTRIVGDRTVPMNSLMGGVSRDPWELARVSDLARQIQSPEGYIRRLIGDTQGNVIEGQHRFDALKSLGANKVPIHQLEDMSLGYDMPAVLGAFSGLHPDQRNRMGYEVLDSLRQYGSRAADEVGMPGRAADEVGMPGRFGEYFNKGIEAALSNRKYADGGAVGSKYPSSPVQKPSGWSPDKEREFQVYMGMDPSVREWRNSFQTRYGEPPLGADDPRGDFNYRYAYDAKEAPTPYAHDKGMPHWGSSGKIANHPTRWMNDFMQQFGTDPNALDSQQVTPEVQGYMNRILPRRPFRVPNAPHDPRVRRFYDAPSYADGGKILATVKSKFLSGEKRAIMQARDERAAERISAEIEALRKQFQDVRGPTEQMIREHNATRPAGMPRNSWYGKLPQTEELDAYRSLAGDLRSKESALERLRRNLDKRQEVAPLHDAMLEYGDLINGAHKNLNMDFNYMGIPSFENNPAIKLHKSPTYNGRQSSEYKLLLTDEGTPAYARKANHWGPFGTNLTDVNEAAKYYGMPMEEAQKLSDRDPFGRIGKKMHNWNLLGGGNPAAKTSQAGYVPLDDLVRMMKEGADLPPSTLGGMP